MYKTQWMMPADYSTVYNLNVLLSTAEKK